MAGAKGRSRSHSRFTEADAKEMLELLKCGLSYVKIATIFSSSSGAIEYQVKKYKKQQEAK